ncbi:MAG: hypothetical protein WBF06_14280 [Candidatus Acidiferrales bacterium]
MSCEQRISPRASVSLHAAPNHDSPECPEVWAANGAGSLEGQEDNGIVFGAQFSGAYAVASNGRTTMVVTPVGGGSSNWIMYVISSSRIIAIRIDPGVMPNTIEIVEK